MANDVMKDYDPISNIGSYLAMKKSAEENYTELAGVSRVPDLFGDPAEIDATSVKLGRKRTIPGVEDISALDFEFFWDNTSTDNAYKRLRAVEDLTFNLASFSINRQPFVIPCLSASFTFPPIFFNLFMSCCKPFTSTPIYSSTTL